MKLTLQYLLTSNLKEWKIWLLNKSSSIKREFSPEEVEILDNKGDEIVEILKEEGTIQEYPPIKHSPTIQPRRIIYSPNYRQEEKEDKNMRYENKNERSLDPFEESRQSHPKMSKYSKNTAEVELQNDTAYIPVDQKESPF